MPVETKPWNPAEVLDTEAAIEEYLIASSEEADPVHTERAQTIAARARLMHGLEAPRHQN